MGITSIVSAQDSVETRIFFAEFAAAAAKAKAKDARGAMQSLDAIGTKVTSSPLAEVILFKKAQLAESVDADLGRVVWRNTLDRAERLSTSGALKSALAEGAKQGLRRIALADVRAALEKYYLKRVEYPESLQALVDKKFIAADKIRDSSGQPLPYKAMPNPATPKIPRQKYSLDVVAEKPFAVEEIAISGTTGTGEGMSAILRTVRESRGVKAGEAFGGFTVALVREAGVILCDKDNVLVIKGK